MKRLIAISLSIILIASVSWGVIAAKITPIPHENPSTAETRFDIVLPSLLYYYSDILNQVAEGNYPEARTLLQELKLDYAHLPEDLIFVMMRYNNLIAELTGKLDSLDSVLDECELFLSQNKLDEASPKLGEARRLAEEATGLIRDTSEATDELLNCLAPFILPQETGVVAEAKAKLQTAIERLLELEIWYKNRVASLEATTEDQESLSATQLTLSVAPAEVWVGDSIAISGILEAEEDIPLTARNVSISLGGTHSITATTSRDGLYQASVALPYWYIPETAAQAFYIPKGADKSSFLASSSPVEKITVLFYPTNLEAEIPEQAYPGLPVEISGKVSSEGNLAQRDVQALLDGSLLWTTTTNNQGLFQHQWLLSSQTLTGKHKLTINIAPESKSRSAGCSIDKTLVVTKATPEVRIEAPKVAISPQKVRVKGELYSALPMQEPLVTLDMAGVSTTATVERGKFEAELAMPLRFDINGFQELTVTAKPLEPWQRPTESKTRIFVLNSANLGVVLAILIFSGVMLSTRRRKQLGEEGESLPALEVEKPVEHAPEKPKIEAEGERGIILRAYFRAVGIVEEITRRWLEPQMTLREFLSEVRPHIGSAVEAFTELNTLAERTLYSPHKPSEDEASRAESLASKVEEAVTSGNS